MLKYGTQKGLIDVREFAEIERKVAARCLIPDKSIYKYLYLIC